MSRPPVLPPASILLQHLHAAPNLLVPVWMHHQAERPRSATRQVDELEAGRLMVCIANSSVTLVRLQQEELMLATMRANSEQRRALCAALWEKRQLVARQMTAATHKLDALKRKYYQ